jgi:hypothetical protein
MSHINTPYIHAELFSPIYDTHTHTHTHATAAALLASVYVHVAHKHTGTQFCCPLCVVKKIKANKHMHTHTLTHTHVPHTPPQRWATWEHLSDLDTSASPTLLHFRQQAEILESQWPRTCSLHRR